MSTPPDTTTRHEYADEEIKQARDTAMGGPSFKSGIGFLRAFLAALPERPQALPGPWPGQQEAIDAAFEQIDNFYLDCKSLGEDWKHEAPDRLAIAQAYDAARPQAAEIARLKAERDKAQAAVAELNQRLIERTRDMLAKQTELIQEARQAKRESRDAQAVREAVRPAIEAECLAQAVRRMEEVPWRELKYVNYEAVRTRLIAAVKGEGQAQKVTTGHIHWHDGTCQPLNEVPQAEAKAEPATFEAFGKTWTRHTPGDSMPCDGEATIQCVFADGDLWNSIIPAKDVRWTKKNDFGDIIGWRYADEPAQAQQAEAQSWTPAVGDTVRPIPEMALGGQMYWHDIAIQLARVWWKCHGIGASLQHGDLDKDIAFSVVCERHGGRVFHGDTPDNAWHKAEEWLLSPDRENFPAACLTPAQP